MSLLAETGTFQYPVTGYPVVNAATCANYPVISTAQSSTYPVGGISNSCVTQYNNIGSAFNSFPAYSSTLAADVTMAGSSVYPLVAPASAAVSAEYPVVAASSYPVVQTAACSAVDVVQDVSVVQTMAAPVTSVYQTHQTMVVPVPVPVVETIVEPPPAIVMGQQKVVTTHKQQVVQGQAPIIIHTPPPPARKPQIYREVHVIESAAKLAEMEEELQNLKMQLDVNEEREYTLRRQVEDANGRLRLNMQREGIITEADAEMARLRNELVAMSQHLKEIEAANAAAEQRAFELQERLRIAEERVARAKMLEAELENLKMQVSEARRRITQSENELQAAHRSINGLQMQVKELEEKMQQQRMAFEKDRAALQDQIMQMRQNLSMAETQRDEAQQQLEFLQRRLRETDEHWQAGEKHLAQIRSAWEVERTQLQSKINEVVQRLRIAEGQRDEAKKQIGFWENRVREIEERIRAAEARIKQLLAQIAALEIEIANLRARLNAKQEMHSQTSIKETYKVKSFEMAAKLAVMDGTDDGMYNGLPIEVEGEGLYRDLVARGRRPRTDAAYTSSLTGGVQTYKVQSFDAAERLSKMGSNDGKYNGLPIEVVGLGLYTDLIRAGQHLAHSRASGTSPTMRAASSTAKGGETYIVTSMDIATSLSKMNPLDDGTYKGLPIEVKGMGLYRELRGRR